MVNLILFKYKCMNKVNILTIRYLLPIKKKSAGHSASPVGYFNYTCMALQKKKGQFVSVTTHC